MMMGSRCTSISPYEAPSAHDLSGYDHQNLVIYLRLLDAEVRGGAWTEIALTLLRIDPSQEPERARRS
jgi:hypothetical protein